MNIQELVQDFKKFFSFKKSNSIAKKIGFIQRKRKIMASALLKNMLFTVIEGREMSLEFISSYFKFEDKISVTKQSLNAKMNEAGVSFFFRNI